LRWRIFRIKDPVELADVDLVDPVGVAPEVLVDADPVAPAGVVGVAPADVLVGVVAVTRIRTCTKM